MYKILKQLQSDVKEVSILLNTSMEDWQNGFISYVDEDCLSFETEARDGIYYTMVVKLSAVIAVEFISDIRYSPKDRFIPKNNKKDSNESYDDDDDYFEEPFNID